MKFAVASSLFALASAQSGYINYTTVTGYFLQDLASTNVTGFDYTAVNFGLINQTYDGISASGTQWQQFAELVGSLNEDSPDDTVYKVFFLGRHGEGYHNAAESYYGTPAWNCYWSILNGNATSTWADADLTQNGINQALIANAFWKREIKNQKIPYPQSYYTSPLTRCLRTANLTFGDLPTPKYYPFVPRVKEFFREGISEHTCDRRSNKTYIHNRFPTYTFDAGFTENDELWNANLAETSYAQDARSKAVLDSVFSSDDHTWVSVTSHSGEIASLLRVLGHRSFSLSTGAVIPVLVKAQFLDNAPVVSSFGTSRTFSAYCTNGPPITSTAQGCVCATTRIVASTGTASSGAVRTSSATSASAKASSGKVSVSTQSTASSSSKATVITKSPSATGKASSKSACKSKSKSASSKGASSKVSVSSRAASSKVSGSIQRSSSAARVTSVPVQSTKNASSKSACDSKSKSASSKGASSKVSVSTKGASSKVSASSKGASSKVSASTKAASSKVSASSGASSPVSSAHGTSAPVKSIHNSSSKSACKSKSKSASTKAASSKVSASTKAASSKVSASTKAASSRVSASTKGASSKVSASTRSTSASSSARGTSIPVQSIKPSGSSGKVCKSKSKSASSKGASSKVSSSTRSSSPSSSAAKATSVPAQSIKSSSSAARATSVPAQSSKSSSSAARVTSVPAQSSKQSSSAARITSVPAQSVKASSSSKSKKRTCKSRSSKSYDDYE